MALETNLTHSEKNGSFSTENFENRADDVIWILTSTFIIFTMQSGFGLLESGSVTIKNEVNIMVKNAVDIIFGGLTYWMFGYAFSFGRHSWSNPFCGWGNFFVQTDKDELGEVYAKFFFQASFATTATTIVSGAMAERTRLESYILFSMLNTLVFCFPAHWVWAEDGWLKTLGMIDVAGAGAVHLLGGATGLVATVMLKPRHGRFQSTHPPPMGSPTNAILGLFMLWWGWLGFNCGSTFGISGFKWKLAARSAISTLVASIAGGIFPCILSYLTKDRKIDVTYLINGILGSLVGITALCALADPWESFVIGFVGAALSLSGIELLNKLRIDDPVGVVGVHGFAAIWSLLTVGLFTKPDSMIEALDITHAHAGLFYGGNWYLLAVQLTGVVAITLWGSVIPFIFLKVIDCTLGLRIPLDQEIIGADVVEHNIGDIEYDKVAKNVIALKKVTDSTYDDQLNYALRRRLTRDLGQRRKDSSNARDDMMTGTESPSTNRRLRYDTNTLWKFALGKALTTAGHSNSKQFHDTKANSNSHILKGTKMSFRKGKRKSRKLGQTYKSKEEVQAKATCIGQDNEGFDKMENLTHKSNNRIEESVSFSSQKMQSSRVSEYWEVTGQSLSHTKLQKPEVFSVADNEYKDTSQSYGTEKEAQEVYWF